jgi:adenylate kinase family enzyme
MNICKVHITGGPGSGKTTLSWQIAASLNAPHYELDKIVYPTHATAPTSATAEAVADWVVEAQHIAMSESWVSEGAYSAWAEPLFQNAELVVWLDIPWRTASYRIVSRHIKASIARNNRWSGWRRLYRFWR